MNEFQKKKILINNFKDFQAQIVPKPLGIEVVKAKGTYIYDKKKKYLDFVAGVSVCNLGHSDKRVIKATINQLKKYSHVMVYGEFALEPSINLCGLLVENLPKNLNSVYLTNSGTEAVEAALKLCKRITGRSKIISSKNSYHGSTHGSLSVSGYEKRKRAYRPLLSNINYLNYNDSNLNLIDENTACVILETIQGGAGFILPKNNYLKKIKKRCNEVGALLILDELQTGLGRTGKLFAFEHFGISPDILLLGKALGGGFPVGAMITKKSFMNKFQKNPILGHITTFGGHPVIAAAGFKSLSIILKERLSEKTLDKETLFRSLLKHPYIQEIRGKGLMIALILKNEKLANQLVLKSLDNVNKNKLASVGWCFGGGWSYQVAKNNLDVKASIIYYGRFNPEDDLSIMRANILGHFAEKDRGIKIDNVKEFQVKLNTLNGEHEIYIYPNTMHGFASRPNENNNAFDKAASDEAWRRTIVFLEKTFSKY